jgi:2-keto-4-pentenoate hydratase/2-oxohepta-3-ene-1,7-dioic acid hydratase in catechol pathway|tara:strand:- start:181 stop:1026 length:846 start_codon:yes stop_codon:yes gene_type:complete
MKLLRFGEPGKEKPAALDKDGKIRDLSQHVIDFNPSTLNFDTLDKLKKINLDSLPEVSSSTRIGSCIAKPGKFLAIGLNYSDHAAETNAEIPKEPIVFNKAANCMVGPNDNVILPKYSKKLDWEIEIAFVIGKNTKYVSEKDAPNHILGYCIVNDISEREWQIERGGTWDKGKSGDTFGPTGPYLVTHDELKDVQNLSMSLDIDEKRMQTGNTGKMIFNMNFILSYLSNFMSLQPGDIVTTGTPPGVGAGMNPKQFLKVGNKLNLKIEQLGEQNLVVIAEK